MNALDLSGKHTVVTGGAQGIGYATVERVVKSGGSVTIWDCDARLGQQVVERFKPEGLIDFVAVDITDFAAVKAAALETERKHERIDAFVNNAGLAGKTVPLVDYPVEEWRRIMQVNLDGPFYALKSILPGMTERGYGRIVNVASIAGKEGNPNACAYSASKAGLIALTKSVAKEVAHIDIAINCVTPAAAKTAIFDQMSQAHIDFMLSRIPRGRFLTTDEAAAMIVWLLTKDNSFTTGGVFDLSGGRATY